MTKVIAIAVFVAIGVVLLLVAVLRRINKPQG